jgi:CubicO group peptidase (beta-lactamase class C family)
MKSRDAAAALCVAALLILPAVGAEPFPRATPESVGLNAARLKDASDLLHRFVAEKKIAGGVAAVARRGRLVYFEAAGVQDLETRAPMTERSMFRIYSMTKPVTAVAAMMLHERGKFALTDPVAKFIPEFKSMVVSSPDGTTRPPARAMTIQDLLLHTSGLNHRTSQLYQKERVRSRAQSLPQFIANIVRVPLMEDPGARYRYSESPTVVGRLVEIWSGQPLDRFFANEIFQPLGMTDTTFWVSPEQAARFTTRYAGGASGLTASEGEDVPFTVRPALLEGAVGLVSTAPDFLRFSQMLLNKGELGGVRLLSSSSVESMTVNGLTEAMVKERNGMGWGIGNVEVVVDAAAQKVPASPGEYGWNGSAGTYFWNDPSLDMITILMTQFADRLPAQFKTLVRQAAE